MSSSASDILSQFEYWPEELLVLMEPNDSGVTQLYQSLISRFNSIAFRLQSSESHKSPLDQSLLRLRLWKENITSQTGSLGAFEQKYPTEAHVVRKQLKTLLSALEDLQSLSNNHMGISTQQDQDRFILEIIEGVVSNLADLSECISTLISVHSGRGPYATVTKFLKANSESETEPYSAGGGARHDSDAQVTQYQCDDETLGVAQVCMGSDMAVAPSTPRPEETDDGEEARDPSKAEQFSIALDNEVPQKSGVNEVLSMGIGGDCQGELTTVMSKYSSSDEFKKLKRLDKENEELRQEVVDLSIRNEKNLEDFIRLKGKWEVEKEGLVAQVKEKEDERNQELLNRRAVDQMLTAERDTTEKLREQAEEQEAQILRLIEKTKKDETELNLLDAISQERNDILDQERRDKAKLQREVNETLKQLETRTEELSDAMSSLTMFRAFLVQLDDLDEKRVQICEALAGMFNAALDFFQRKLGHDLDADVLARSNSHTFALNAPPIPLPASNTEDAKRMRIVAGLMVYGKALVNNVFRPTYNTQSHQLDEVLHLTAAQNPSQETFIRAVLLKAAPEKQQQNRESCVELAVQEVLGVVDPWIQNKLEFRSELKHICDRASTAWAQVQLLESRVRPDFRFQHPEEWKALPFPILQPNPTIVSKVGNSKQTHPQKRMQGRQPDLSTVSPKLSALNSSEVATVVWPSFLATDPQAFDDETGSAPLELVYYGYVLTQAQIKGAEDETSQVSQRVPLRPRKRRDSGVFVSNSKPAGPSAK